MILLPFSTQSRVTNLPNTSDAKEDIKTQKGGHSLYSLVISDSWVLCFIVSN